MAVVTSKNLSSLKLYFDKGVDINSKRIMGTKTFGFVDPEALDQDIMDVANALAGLQKHTLYNVVRIDNTSLSE
ncbi:DUF1659 domain-containing protein [Intestinibacter sp.]|uniref:DUF1659 domain-containing protein n=1 Tax=Intestinibacter sp. TaxID=1965304 RepID=UPI002A748BF0|nr:DUF1659 domain-containing protein [Intestinibacter sp.]MDY2737213.1 DUF1659 domain-containing protein [Intestinibacter sp.]MDY4576050.1 DUF1659 domain-containing protein [Intestinibacter sp.]